MRASFLAFAAFLASVGSALASGPVVNTARTVTMPVAGAPHMMQTCNEFGQCWTHPRAVEGLTTGVPNEAPARAFIPQMQSGVPNEAPTRAFFPN